jgi:hypothetical protein
VVLFGVAMLAVLVGAIGAIQWYGTHTYYVGASERDGAQVVTLFKGRSGGLLWVDPSIVEQTSIPVDSLNDAQRLEIGNETARSEERARTLVQVLTTATTTTTTAPPTTTSPTTTVDPTASTTTIAGATTAPVTPPATTVAPAGP